MMWTVLNILNIPSQESIHLNAHRKNIQNCKVSLHYSIFSLKMFSIIALFIKLDAETQSSVWLKSCHLENKRILWILLANLRSRIHLLHSSSFFSLLGNLKIGKIWFSDRWLQWGEKPCIFVFFSQFSLRFLLNFYMVTDNGIEKGNAKFQVSLCVLLSVITHLNSTRWRSCATDTGDFKNRLF